MKCSPTFELQRPLEGTRWNDSLDVVAVPDQVLCERTRASRENIDEMD